MVRIVIDHQVERGGVGLFDRPGRRLPGCGKILLAGELPVYVASMSHEAILIGFDFGTTTSCAVIASATIGRNTNTGRLEFRDFCPRLVSQPVFTPFIGDCLDEQKLRGYLDAWLSGVDTSRVVGGGAVVTGLAARQTNA
ncbi:MAG TPA: hypothetical protein VHY20_15185, partial [Pirellulales bacterium]|nr:hypothetical protein [Pirellulales bacterium]